MSPLQKLLSALSQLGSSAWINQYFDLIKQVITDLKLNSDDPRLLLSTPADGRLPMTLGQRYVLLSRDEEIVHCIVPVDFPMEGIEGYEPMYEYGPNTTKDARWVTVRYPIGSKFPPALYAAVLSECRAILARTVKTSFQRYRNELVYDFIMEPQVRKELLHELQGLNIKYPVTTKVANSSFSAVKRILLTWNPKRWEWKEIEDDIEEVRQFGSLIVRWSCGVSKSIQPGDRAFLILLGSSNKKGIVGSGIVLSYPFVGEHFSDEDREANYIEVAFDTLINPYTDEEPLAMDLLKEQFPEQQWSPQGSGIAIRENIVEQLEGLWFEHLRATEYACQPWHGPEQLPSNDLYEGGSYQIIQTRYERNPEARRRCLQHYGYACHVCGFEFEKVWGELGREFIHVHHRNPISEAGGTHVVDPVKDLRPVCPNCHAMIHRQNPPLDPDTLRKAFFIGDGKDV